MDNDNDNDTVTLHACYNGDVSCGDPPCSQSIELYINNHKEIIAIAKDAFRDMMSTIWDVQGKRIHVMTDEECKDEEE